MKPLARISAIGVVGLGLGAVGVAAGQVDGSQAASNTTSKTPATGAIVTASGPQGSAAILRSESTGGIETAQQVTNPALEHNSNGGGYSWTDRRNRTAKHRKAVTLDPTRPIAQAPNFAMRADGTSVVILALSQAVQVTRVTEGDHVEYRLKDAQIGVSNNMNPLVTAHFASPVTRIAMQRTREGAVLVLELREAVQPIHQIRTSSAGGIVLEVTLPKPSRSYSPPAVRQRSRAIDETVDGAQSMSRVKHRTTKSVVRKPGPGPRP